MKIQSSKIISKLFNFLNFIQKMNYVIYLFIIRGREYYLNKGIISVTWGRSVIFGAGNGVTTLGVLASAVWFKIWLIIKKTVVKNANMQTPPAIFYRFVLKSSEICEWVEKVWHKELLVFRHGVKCEVVGLFGWRKRKERETRYWNFILYHYWYWYQGSCEHIKGRLSNLKHPFFV